MHAVVTAAVHPPRIREHVCHVCRVVWLRPGPSGRNHIDTPTNYRYKPPERREPSQRMASDLRKVLRAAEEQGWRVERGKKGQYKLYSPDGEGMVTLHQSHSDHRALKNAISIMRRYGFRWEGR